MNQYQTEYLNVWKRGIPFLLGWSDEQLMQWAATKIQDLSLPGMVLNEPPLYYIAEAIVWNAEDIEEMPVVVRERLVRDIEHDILGPNFARDFRLGFDFESAKGAIDSLIKNWRLNHPDER